MVITYNKSCFFSYGQKQLHVKRLEEYETNTDQLTNLGFGGVSSTCPYMGQDGEYWVLKGALYRIWCGVNRLGDSGVKVV